MEQLFGDYVELYSRINKNEWITVFEENDKKDYNNDIFTFCAMLKGTDVYGKIEMQKKGSKSA